MSQHRRALTLAYIAIAVCGVLLTLAIKSQGDLVEGGESSQRIYLGQPYDDARAIARASGYELHDASKLALVGPAGGVVDGFYINPPSKRGLIVYCAPKNKAVEQLEIIDNWPGPKASRVYRTVKAVRFPRDPHP